MMLEDIGFYTLSDNRALNVNAWSPMMRCEFGPDRPLQLPPPVLPGPAAGVMCPVIRPHNRYIMPLRNLISAASREREQKGRVPYAPLETTRCVRPLAQRASAMRNSFPSIERAATSPALRSSTTAARKTCGDSWGACYFPSPRRNRRLQPERLRRTALHCSPLLQQLLVTGLAPPICRKPSLPRSSPRDCQEATENAGRHAFRECSPRQQG